MLELEAAVISSLYGGRSGQPVWELECNITQLMQKSQSVKGYSNNTYSLGGVMEYLNQQIHLLTEKEANWEQERQMLQRKITGLEMELSNQRNINDQLMKKMKHRRTSSEERTFIFNQTNISSYYPIVMMPRASWASKQNLRSHLDSVRSLAWHGDYLISSGEDCLMKVWRHGELLGTVREHLGAVYAMTHYKNKLWTGGFQGIIRQWDISDIQKGAPICLLDNQFHSDVIWELNHHPTLELLLSSAADGIIKLFKTADQLQPTTQFTKQLGDQFCTPTSVDWLSGQHLVAGYVGQTQLSVFDIQTQKIVSSYKYTSNQEHHQVNKVLYHQHYKTIMTAHEDKIIRFFDSNSNKLIKALVAHTDAVTSMTFQAKSVDFSSCSHDGSVRAWDIRKFKCLNDIPIHRKKYDEGANVLLQHPQDMVIAVGGADGIIKMLYESD